MFLKDRDILFIHIPKTCGKLITDNLRKNSKVFFYGHYPYKIWKDLYPIINNNTIIFSFIRNPWSKMLSLYIYSLKNHRNIVPWFSQKDDIDLNFNKWLKWNYTENIEKLKNSKIVNIKTNNIDMISNFELNFSNQVNLLCYENGKINDNITIIKYEDFCKNNNIIIDFFNKNKLVDHNFNRIINASEHKPYNTYYNDESIQLIKNYFSIDIEKFDYKFESI